MITRIRCLGNGWNGWEWWQGDLWPQVATKNYWTEGEPLAPRSYQLMIALVLSSPKTQNSFQPSRSTRDRHKQWPTSIDQISEKSLVEDLLKTLLSIIWLASETNWGKRGVGAEDAKGNFVIFQTTRCAALNPLSWSPMHHLPSSNLSIRIKTTNLVTNNTSSNCKTVNISVQAENIHGLKSGKCQGENLRCIPSRPGSLSLIWQKPAWFQLQGNCVHIYHLNRLSWVRWPKKKLNEQWNVQQWTILNNQCLILIFYTKFSFFQNMWALWGKL